MEKILSINIVSQNNENTVLLNPAGQPIIFYWNDINNNNMIDEIFNDTQFLSYLNSNILNTKYYSHVKLCYNEYNIVDDNIKQQSINLQEIYDLENNNLLNLCYEYIFDIMKNLYNISFKQEYNNTFDLIIDSIIDIYSMLKDKYKDRISPETLRQYIRSQLQQEYNLFTNNMEYILTIYNGLIA